VTADTSTPGVAVASVTNTPDVVVTADTSTPDVAVASVTNTPHVVVTADTSTPGVAVASVTNTPDVVVTADTSTPDVAVASVTNTPDVVVTADISTPDVAVASDKSTPDIVVTAETSIPPTLSPIKTENVKEMVSVSLPFQSEQILAIASPNGTPEMVVTPVSQGVAWVYISLIFMAMATIFSVAVSFYLYRWRKILISKPNAMVPEEWGKYLHQVGSDVSALTNSLNINLSAVVSKTCENSEKVANMTETYMALQGALDEKDAEIRRLKKGYDAEIFRKFLLRFVRVGQAIDDFIDSDEVEVRQLEQLKRLLEDAFDECGVEIYHPEVGDDYRNAEGVADNPKTINTVNNDDDFKIAEVIASGYRLRVGETFDCIVPAKVRVFSFSQIGG
jgi:hypothetical protein